MDAAAAEIGATANSYQVLAKLATGGMAEIFLARSAGVAAVQRYVVLKRVLRERASDINFVRMFLDEARLAAQLQHPNVAQVFDAGKLGDSYFFTMEYVHGETVRAMLHQAYVRRRSPPLGCVLAIAAGTAAGLHHAHTRIGIEGRPLGIVHRDISPSNLMVGFDGSVKVVDFGVAKAADRITETHSGAVKGKISYLSPEQARGAKLDRRSDLFSLGIVLWEMLTLERLYKHESDFATMQAIVQDAPPPPSSRRRDVPPELDALVLRALAKSPEARFQSAEELGEAIEQVAVKTGSTLSAAGLSRFVRELFGAKPEPWLALASKPERAEVVTVTSEPIPKELAIRVSDPVDRRLAAVADLSVSEPLDLAAMPPLAIGGRPPTASEAAAVPPSGAATVTGVTGVTGLTGVTELTGLTVTGSAAGPRRRRASRSPLVLGGLVLAIAVVVALVVAFQRDELPATAAGDAAPPPLQEQVAAGPVVTPIVVDAPVIDAAEAAPADAEIAATAAIDAAAGDEPEPPQQPQPPPAGSGKKPARPVRPPVTARKPVELAKLLEGRRYADAVAECAGNAAADRALCVRAACHAGDAAKARRWLARVAAAQQARSIDACAALGVRLVDDKPPKPDCADPMDCPR